jgi:hypothetical protein
MSSPYFYILEEKSTGKYYAGSRTAKGCHPSDLLSSYPTSSNTVQKIGTENFTIRKLVPRADAYDYEMKFLKKVKAATNPRFHNKTERKLNTDTHRCVKDPHTGEIESVLKDDPRFLSGELVHHSCKGMEVMGIWFNSRKEAQQYLGWNNHAWSRYVKYGDVNHKKINRFSDSRGVVGRGEVRRK